MKPEILPPTRSGNPFAWLAWVNWGHGMIGKATVAIVVLLVLLGVLAMRIQTENGMLTVGAGGAPSPLMALRDMLHCGGRASLTEHCGHGWTCSLPRPIALDTRQPPSVGTLKKGLPRPRLSAIIMSPAAGFSS